MLLKKTFIYCHMIEKNFERRVLILDKLAFGKQIKVARQKNKLTAEQLAEKLDIGDKSVWQIESGKRATSLEVLIKLCNTLHVSPQFLLKKDLDENLRSLDTEYEKIFQLILQLNPSEQKRIHDIIKITIENRDKYK